MVKIERPGGEAMRPAGPRSRGGVNSAFAMMNRNKRSLCLDLGSEEGKGVLRRLLRSADVISSPSPLRSPAPAPPGH